MQQLYTTTETQNEQTLSYAPAEAISLPENSTVQGELTKEQQQQSEAVERLLTALERDNRKRQKWNVLLRRTQSIYLIVFIIALPIAWMMRHKIGGMLNFFQFSGLINMVGYALGVLILDKKSVGELVKVHDLRCVGALADVWGSQDSVNYASAVLTRILSYPVSFGYAVGHESPCLCS